MRNLSIAAVTILFLLGDRQATAQIVLGFNPYSDYFVQSVRQNQEAWKQLGAEATDAVSPKLVAVEVTMSCGIYTELEASYSNGWVESKEIPSDAPAQARLGSLFQRNRAIVSVVSEPCME